MVGVPAYLTIVEIYQTEPVNYLMGGFKCDLQCKLFPFKKCLAWSEFITLKYFTKTANISIYICEFKMRCTNQQVIFFYLKFTLNWTIIFIYLSSKRIFLKIRYCWPFKSIWFWFLFYWKLKYCWRFLEIAGYELLYLLPL